MSTRRFRSPLALSAALLLFASLSACDSIDTTSDAASIEVEAAADILGSTLSESDGGLVANLQDLTATVSADGLGAPRIVRVGGQVDRRNCQGNFGLTYIEATGTHAVRYQCAISTPFMLRTSSANLAYRFRTADGTPVARPWADWATVDSVTFRGTRAGSIRHTRGGAVARQSAFEENATWRLTNLLAAAAGTSPASLVGEQTRSGTHTHRDSTGQPVERTFLAEISTDDAQISTSDEGVAYATTGTLAYRITLGNTATGESRVIEGTIDLEGNGRALLRFQGLRTVYRISLADGTRTRLSV
jgi:hypothetical protein